MVVKGVNIPDEWIDKQCETLDLSIDEAVDMYLSDKGIVQNAEQEALNKTAGAVKVNHGAKSTADRKKVERKREPNAVKREIITNVRDFLADFASIDSLTISNAEKYIDFEIDGRSFTINLVEHRKPKK